MMEQALNVIYFLAEHPETIAESIIKKIAACLLDKPENTVDPEEETTSEREENGKKWNVLYIDITSASKYKLLRENSDKWHGLETAT